MSVKIITKATMPTGHVSPKRWIKYIARNEPLVKTVKNPDKYLHSGNRRPFDIRDNTTVTLLGDDDGRGYVVTCRICGEEGHSWQKCGNT